MLNNIKKPSPRKGDGCKSALGSDSEEARIVLELDDLIK